MSYKPENIKEWTPADPAGDFRTPDHPSHNYIGAKWNGWYVAGFKHRDSDLLTQSNFDEIKKALEPLSTDIIDDGEELPSVNTTSTGHWAVGWCEWLLVHSSNEPALRKADELAGKLRDYPVLNEDDFSQREYDAAQESWENTSLRDKIDLCKKAGLSIFSARSKSIPQDDNGFIYDRMRSD